MKEQFISWRPSSATRELLSKTEEVLIEYQTMGYRLTLRQLYYQLVSRSVIPNTVKQYKFLGNIISQARLAGIIDWSMIEDRVRHPVTNAHWNKPKNILDAAADDFYIDRWMNINYHIEVWCEKDAVSNIIQPVCSGLDVLFIANRGYSSQTAMYDAGKRFLRSEQLGKEGIILYFGDHDPSGMDMTRDVSDRLRTFRADVTVKRIALNMSQIEEFHPPENPAKRSDSRFESYVNEHGESSWELDALAPDVLSRIIRESIYPYVDVKEFKRIEKKQEYIQNRIRELAENFEEDEDA